MDSGNRHLLWSYRWESRAVGQGGTQRPILLEGWGFHSDLQRNSSREEANVRASCQPWPTNASRTLNLVRPLPGTQVGCVNCSKLWPKHCSYQLELKQSGSLTSSRGAEEWPATQHFLFD